MDYASPLWAGKQVDERLATLERIQRRALLVASGAYSTASLAALQVDCCVPPLDLRFTEQALKWRGKILRLHSSHTLKQQCLTMIKNRHTQYPTSFLALTRTHSNIHRAYRVGESAGIIEPLPSTLT